MPDQSEPASVTGQDEPKTTTPTESPTTSGDEVFISEEDLRKMDLPALLALCKENDIPIDSSFIMGGKRAVLKHLLDTFGA